MIDLTHHNPRGRASVLDDDLMRAYLKGNEIHPLLEEIQYLREELDTVTEQCRCLNKELETFNECETCD